jgi:hypothetical protein
MPNPRRKPRHKQVPTPDSWSLLQWVRHVFDRPTTSAFDTAEPHSEPAPLPALDLMTSLFSRARSLLQPYTVDQVDQGLRYLLDLGSSGYMFHVVDPELPWPQRERCLASMELLFTDYFAQLCLDTLEHTATTSQPLNGVCYMWWDLFPTSGRPSEPQHANTDRFILSLLERLLRLPSVACQESALHGLGHWHHAYPNHVEAAIAVFLEAKPQLDAALRRYAESARVGCVL